MHKIYKIYSNLFFIRSLENVICPNLHYLTRYFYEDKIHLDSIMIYFLSFRVFYSLKYKNYFYIFYL